MEEAKHTPVLFPRPLRAIAAFILAPLAAPLLVGLFTAVLVCVGPGPITIQQVAGTALMMAFFGGMFSYTLTIPSACVCYYIILKFKIERVVGYIIISFMASCVCFVVTRYGSKIQYELTSFFFLFVSLGILNGIAFWLIERPDRP